MGIQRIGKVIGDSQVQTLGTVKLVHQPGCTRLYENPIRQQNDTRTWQTRSTIDMTLILVAFSRRLSRESRIDMFNMMMKRLKKVILDEAKM